MGSRLAVFFGGAIVVAAVVIAFARRGDTGVDEIDRAPVTTESVVMLGDSITALGEWDRLLPGYPVANAGHPGYTSEQLVPVAAEVADRRPAVVFVLAGTNDIRDSLPASATGDHVARIVDAIATRSPGTRIVVQTLLPRADAIDAVRAANAEIERVAAERGVELLRLTEAFDDGAGGLRAAETPDGVHLSAAGYDRWATLLLPVLDAS